jgi:NAD-dependent deacetylase
MTAESVRNTAELLATATRIVVLTGAGISTDSGIPDYRGPDGVWTRDPEAARLVTLDDYLDDPEVRVKSWRARLNHPAWSAQPNAAHRALVDLERAGRLNAILTQNIDALHQKAGSNPDRVLEMHGSMSSVECWNCAHRSPMADALARVSAGEEDPPCTVCGGILKSSTIFFGQSLDPDVMRRAADAATGADALITIGTSLQVYPVAGLVDIAAVAGATIVIVNREPTPYDRIADAVLREPIGEVVPALATALVSQPTLG